MIDIEILDEHGPEQHRILAFEESRSQLHVLSDSLESLLRPLSDEDEFMSADLVLYATLWRRVLDADAAKVSYAAAPAELRATLWLNSTLLESLSIQLMVIKQKLESLLDVSAANYHVGQLGDELEAAIRRYKSGNLSYLPAGYRSELDLLVEGIAREMDEYRARNLDRLADRAERAVSRTEAAAEAASAAAGVAGEAVLSAHYDSLAKDERAAANLFRWLTTFLALVAGGAALGFVLGSGSGIPWLDIQAGDFVHLLQRGLLVGGVLGLAGYFARQAHQHRSMANWAGSLAVQLKTFESYLSPISDDQVKNELRRLFAARVFGDHPAMKGEPSVTPTAEMGEKAMDLAAKVLGR